MKITEIVIKEYGPVHEFTLKPGEQACIYGYNESGKTAIVEVLTYVLFKRSVAHLRYPKPKSVHIIIEDRGRQFTLPSKKHVLSLPSIDIASMLYVHASQSSIFSEGTKGRFWDGLKAVLSGMESGITYAKLDEKVFTIVGLQPKKEEWKQEKQEQVDNDLARKAALGDYITKVAEIEQAQTERRRLEMERKQIEIDYAAIESWKKHKKYDEVSRLYTAYRTKGADLQNYERYKPAYIARWQELELMKRSQAKDRTKLQSVEQEIVELERQKMDLQRKQDFIDAWDITPGINIPARPIKPIAMILPLVVTAVIAFMFVLSFFTPIPTLIAAIVLAISLGISGFIIYRRREVHRCAIHHARILSKAEQLFPGVSTLHELVTMIEQTRNDMIRVTTLLTEKKEIKKHLSSNDTESRIDPEIADIRGKTGLAELQDLKQKLEEKQTLETQRDKLYGTIFGILGEKNDGMWERMIQNMKAPAPTEEPDVAREQELHETLATLEKRISDLDKQITIFLEIQKTTYGIDDPRSAFVEYDRLVKKLQEYELEKKAALTARQVFADMSTEQDDYIHDVISGDHGLSEYFKIVTDRYDMVLVKDKDFVVQDTHGKTYPIDGLSSGARDQLLLCFRLAALSKAYPEGIFLILDDAFIFADWPRRNKIMDLIAAFTHHGNQILYFTSDDHTRDLFREYGTPVTSLH
jgi:energy-coupling factor transporter ATP-binding protein EcfA2